MFNPMAVTKAIVDRIRTGEGTDLILVHNPESSISYGSYRCQDCGSSFYGGGEALHKKDCPRAGSYAGLEYLLGDVAIRKVLGGSGSLNPCTADDVREQLPEHVARIEGQKPETA